MKNLINIFLFAWLILAACLGSSATFIVAKTIGGWSDWQSLAWMFFVLIGIVSAFVFLNNKKN